MPSFLEAAVAALAVVQAGAPLLSSAALAQSSPATDDIVVTGSVYKLDVPARETPQIVETISRDQLDRRNVQSIEEALRYIPGVQAELSGRVGYDDFLIRGFYQSAYEFKDGLRLDPNYLQQQEEFGLERIEVLKGPASVLYGQIAPGGLVNEVSKIAGPDRRLDLEGTLGSFGLRRFSVDAQGAITPDGTLSVRLPMLYSHRGDPQDFVSARRLFVAPSLTWKPDAATTLTILGLYQDDRHDRTLVLPFDGTVLPNPNGRVRRSTFLGEPGLTRLRSPQWQLGYLLDHRFADWLTFRSKLRTLHYDNRGAITFVDNEGSTDDTITRGGFFYDATTSNLALDNQIEATATTGPIEHRLLLGVDHDRYRSHGAGEQFDLAPIGLFHPVYGAAPVDAGPFFSSRARLDETGLYAQYRGKAFDRLIGLIGARRSYVDNVSIDRLAGSTTEQKDRKTTLNAALMLLGPLGLSPYVSYAESFEPQVGYDPLTSGGTPPPSRGRQTEAGAKWRSADGRYGATIAAYRILRSNIVNEDPDNPGHSVLIGRERHKGVDVDVTARPSAWLSLTAAYAFIDARITQSLNGDQGLRPANVPRNAASVYVALDGRAIGLAGADADVGIRYVGRRQSGSGPTGPTLPAFTAVDVGFGYRLGQYRLGLNVKNLFDQRYYSGITYNGVIPGDPRVIEGSVRAAF